ncbi:MAG: trypsin-like peptidase domain-containing protein [Acidobacteria bacterium]|nr:trypsin-like peptidase domain-containing protein [Acidobacteriota bacterium]
MNNGIVIRLAGIEQPATRILHQEVITIGTAPDCDLVVSADEGSLPPESILLTLRRRDDAYRLTTVEPMAGITRDGEAVAIGETVQDGDTFFFGATGIRLRFFSLTDNETAMESITGSLRLGNAVLASARPGNGAVADAARHKRMVPRTDVAIVFVKQLLRELVSEIPRRLLYAIAGLAVFFLLLFVYFPTLSFLEGRRNNRAISELKETTRSEIDKLREEIKQDRERQLSLQRAFSLPEIVVNTYGQGVCLIYGVYSFVDQRVGREVRFKEPSHVENPIGPDGNVNLSVDGNGRVYEVEFMGTGFLAEKGLILTNRHVVQAWEDDDLASLIRMRGFRPKLKDLLAYFPQTSEPFSLRPLELMQDQDVAICSFEQGDANLPVLPLDDQGESIASGQPVVLLGYPAGLEGLKARVDKISGSGFLRMGNVPYRTQLNELAASNKIRPQSTQGHISDISPHLTYDARTDEGGSGGPVFGSNGKVIGINQAILLNSSTTNFGVPIRYGVELIKKHTLASPMPSPSS